jgi:TRAP-type mannitol/chloroaromatic compound transport system permease large subunit
MSLIFILLGTFFLLAFLGVPIAISLGVASGIGMLTAGVSVSGIAQRMFAGVDSFSYLAIPMFMLAGKLMEYGGISARIVQVAKILCAKVRGRSSHYLHCCLLLLRSSVRLCTGNGFRHRRHHVSGDAQGRL